MPPITQEGQNAKNRIAEFRQNINNGATAKEARATVRQIEAGPTAPAPLTSTVSAKSLVNPPTPVTVSAPVVPPPPAPSPLVAPVRAETDNIIRANTEESKRLQELRDSYSMLNDQGSLSDLFNTQKQELGITDNLKELKDIQLRLTDNNTASELTKTRIEGGAGQTLGQGQREVTQEDRENAVRSSGLAARAAVLQGNIETATALAKDTVDMAFKDRQITAQNLINQINDIRSTVDEQTGQLLEQDKRKYEAELARIKELKDNIATAMVNGASQAEIGQLNDPNLDDATKLTLAQQITARGANQMRNLDMAAKEASIANSYDAIAARAEQNKALLGTLNGKQQTEGEKMTEGYANRMLEAEGTIKRLGAEFSSPKSIFGEYAPNALKSASRQEYEQAQRNFINAVLRKESGAVISTEEFDNAKRQYFPQPGDSAGVISQKEQNRLTTVSGLYNAANVPMPELTQAVDQTTPLQNGSTGVTTSGLSYTISIP